jgi:hypothetical protein
MTDPAPPDLERIASIALGEFRRHVPLALRRHAYQWTDQRSLAISAPDCAVTVTVDELEPLRLSGLLSLPRLRVAFTFTQGDEAARQAFMAEWDRAFLRGGG